ncbi:MAG: HEAT repeat domain-containing protein [Anaerolineae bacterium]|nr:HEAT repeat domain-containing protein [Anaerolineae bacterium]
MTKPPVVKTTKPLPFDALSPEEFEHLCLELVQHEGYERAEHLGAAGSEQGRDLIAWCDGEMWAFQCKRVQQFGPSAALKEVDKVLSLPDDERPAVLAFLVTCRVSAETRRQVRKRCGEVMDCQFWAYTELDARVWRYPDLIRKFFGAATLEVAPDLETLRTGYMNSLRSRYAYLDLGGIAPKVANRTVKLAMRDMYVPVEAEPALDIQAQLSRLDLEVQLWQMADRLRGEVEISEISRRLGLELLRSILPETLDEIHEEQLARVAIGSEYVQLRSFLAHSFAGLPQSKLATVKDILSSPRAVLLGHPGTGKSTTLKYAAYAVAAGLGELVGEEILNRLPILVRLVDYAQARTANPTLSLRDYVRDAHDPDRAPLFRHALENGEALVMLDGLDEVIDPQQRAEIADQVEALVADYPGGPTGENHYLVASRIVGYEAGWLTGDFSHFTLGPLPQASIESFVQKWYEAIEREGGAEVSEEVQARAEELCRVIEERPGIRRLAENPLLLTIIALVNWKGRRLPNRRVEVYRHAAETLVESWPRVRRGVEFDGEEVLSLLEPVAYRIFADQSSEEIREGDLLPLLVQAAVEVKPGLTETQARAYVRDLLPQLSEHSGLFLPRGFDRETGEQVFGFLHLTFAEYLAARHLAARWQAEKDDAQRRASLARYAHVPRWREVFLLMVAHIGLDGRRVPATQVLADVLQLGSAYEEHLHRDLLLAATCLTDGVLVDAYASEHVLDRLALLLVRTPIWSLRSEIVGLGQQTAHTIHEAVLVECLLGYFDSSVEEWAARAAWALGNIKSEKAMEALIIHLSSPMALTRFLAARALGHSESERAIDNLFLCLEDRVASVRNSAVWALGEIKCERAVDCLLSRLDDPMGFVRTSTARALGTIGSERAVERLLTHLNDSDTEVRASIVEALGEIGSERALNDLLLCLEDRFTSVRASAARALGRIGSEQAVDDLLVCLRSRNRNVCIEAAQALGAIKSERAVDDLLACISEDDAMRITAAKALAEICDKHGLSSLLVRLNHTTTAMDAVEALGWIGRAQAVVPLLSYLSDENEYMRSTTAWALGRIGSEQAVDDLLGSLEDNSDEVRASVIEALGEIGSKRAVDNLLPHLSDSSMHVCTCAARALGEIGSAQAVDSLLTHLNSPSTEVRASVIGALGKIGSTQAVDSLLTHLNDPSMEVRTNVAWALGAIRDERAVDDLLVHLDDPNADMRDSTVWALSAIRSERVIGALLNWLSDTEWWDLAGQQRCIWAYTTILEILAHHALDPGIESQQLTQEPAVIGPWSKG